MTQNQQIMNFVADISQRLDIYLTKCTSFTRSYLKQLIDEGYVKLNGQAVKCGKLTAIGDKIELCIPKINTTIPAQDIPLNIIYEDDDLAIINKQANLSVHPSPNHNQNTLVNALMFSLKNLSAINGETRPGIVHRLDKDTTGVMIVAKNDKAHLNLSRQLANRKVKKIYHALLDGKLSQDNGQIKTLITRDTRDRKKMMAVLCEQTISTTKNVFCSLKGREAISLYKVLQRFEANTYVEFNILTGRTHQIRVHSKFIGCPVVGDNQYGLKKQRIQVPYQLLHAYSITFTHPSTKKEVTFTAPLPEYFTQALNNLQNGGRQ